MRSVNVVIMLEAHQQEFTSYFPTNANICGHMQRMTATRDSSCELQVTHFNSGIIYIPPARGEHKSLCCMQADFGGIVKIRRCYVSFSLE